jgi:KaiC/GvpD/RAD55 family RecA-like ATPase
LPKPSIEPLLKKAKKSEKKYDWLSAAEGYEKASAIAAKENNWLKAAQLCDQLGFCYFRAAAQAEAYPEFRERIKLAVRAYEQEGSLFEATGNKDQTGTKHAKAFAAYAQSYLETTAQKRRELLAEWWVLENQVLTAYESAGDLLSVGKTCNRMLEHSNYYRFWLTKNLKERRIVLEEAFILAEKAIQSLSKLNDIYELARAYCFASWFYSWGDEYWELEDKILLLNQKCRDYADKALALSQKTGDAWLISWAHIVAWNAAFMCNLNPALGLDFAEKVQKYGKIAKDNFLMGFGNTFIAWSKSALALMQEDPDKQKAMCERAAVTAQEGINNFHKINHTVGTPQTYGHLNTVLTTLYSIESDPEKKKAIVKKIIKMNEELYAYLRKGTILNDFYLLVLSRNLFFLSKTKGKLEEKRKLLQKAQVYGKRHIALIESIYSPFWALAFFYHEFFLVQNDLAKIESNDKKKIGLLSQCIKSIVRSIEIIEKKRSLYSHSGWQTGFLSGLYHEKLGRTIQQVYSLSKKKKRLEKAITAYETASLAFKKVNLPTHAAESFWHIAQLYGQLGEHQEAATNYEGAAQAYGLSTEKIPQLKEFYKNFSYYMLAWSHIEQAMYKHSVEEYDEAREHYENAAKLHEASEPWRFLAPNYFAWATMEEAEMLSRRESTQQAKKIFQKALKQFSIAEKSVKQKLGGITSADEKEMVQRMLKASDLRRKFCQARIFVEEGKLFDRTGKYLQSAKRYGEAVKKIETIIEQLESEAERREVRLMGVLCRAWEKMANAEETTSSESYVEAAKLFEQAKDLSVTKSKSLWALGNSSFCKGLAAGIRYQSSLDITEHAEAKGLMKSAATSYLQAGVKSAAEYAKATQRLFDAYRFMNEAEREVNQEKRAKQYQMAENLLQISAGSFMKAKQPEKTMQVQKILESVREERDLAVSLNEVLHAPAVASTTKSFGTPTPTSEVSVGLERFEHANVQANLIASARQVKVGESFCLTVEFVNAGKEPALLIRVEDFVPPDFTVIKKPEIYRLEESCLNMKGKQIAPLKLVEAKLVLQPSKKGIYQLKPTFHYLDELGQNRSLQLKSVEIKVEEIILADRVSTGTKELDSLLLGGIPKEYAVVLTGPPSDERELIIKNFLEAGVGEGQTSFYVTTEANGLDRLLEKSGFYLFLCNPKPKIKLPDLPNVFKLLGKTDLTNLNIALLKAYRSVEQSSKKRVCLDIVSDVLLHHGAETTRKWISELITDMVSKGFTVLAVLDPSMHPSDQANAILNLFDGEVSLYQTEDPLECKKSIQVKKLRNQDYIKNPICLT